MKQGLGLLYTEYSHMFLQDMSSVGSFSRLFCGCPVGVKFLSLAVGACSLEPRDESFAQKLSLQA